MKNIYDINHMRVQQAHFLLAALSWAPALAGSGLHTLSLSSSPDLAFNVLQFAVLLLSPWPFILVS